MIILKVTSYLEIKVKFLALLYKKLLNKRKRKIIIASKK
jgi:hypothetical protein